MQNATVIDLLNQYGFATIAAIGMGWFIYFIYKYITTEIKVKLGEMNIVLIALIDRVRMLDNDIIRLKSKVNTVLELREKEQNPPKTPPKKRNT
jgi:hypothetical protein